GVPAGGAQEGWLLRPILREAGFRGPALGHPGGRLHQPRGDRVGAPVHLRRRQGGRGREALAQGAEAPRRPCLSRVPRFVQPVHDTLSAEEATMADWRKTAKAFLLADGGIDDREVAVLRKEVFADGKADETEVDFLLELRREAKRLV